MCKRAKIWFGLTMVAVVGWGALRAPAQQSSATDTFERENLVAWCIVPFDGKQRGPAERAAMLAELGLRRVAYDWRAEHVPTFEQEIIEYQKQGIEYFAFWSTHEAAFELFERYGLHPQIWQIAPSPEADSEQRKVELAAEALLPLVDRTRQLGSKLGLYNHGGWSGRPENLVAICEFLRQHHAAEHVGIVYNLHHAHDAIDGFASSLRLMKPYLLCLNLNGMTAGGDQQGQKILPVGAGELDVQLLQTIQASGYAGPIGIIGHTQDDVEQRLRDNLDGLAWVRAQLDGEPSAQQPQYRTWSPPQPAAGEPAADDSSQHSKRSVAEWLDLAGRDGDARRGLMVFGAAQTACLACHQLGQWGGDVGPNLSETAPRRSPEALVESILWPARQVEPAYAAHRILTVDGETYRGYIVNRDQESISLRDPSRGGDEPIQIDLEQIELQQPAGTLMPDNLLSSLSEGQVADLIRLLLDLRSGAAELAAEIESVIAHAQLHAAGPAEFAYDRRPLDPAAWPHWQAAVNRQRIYDYYAKQADHFRRAEHVPALLAEFPGLDGTTTGHWGNQDETTWASNHWNQVRLGSVQCGIFRGGGITVPRGVGVQLGTGETKRFACFNPDTLAYEAVWKDRFLKFSEVRHGFLDGMAMAGVLCETPPTDVSATGAAAAAPTEGAIKYHGFYRLADRVVFAYRIGDQEYLDWPWVEAGRLVRHRIATDRPPPDLPAALRAARLEPAAAASPEPSFTTSIRHGTGRPYAIDTIEFPIDNPCNAPFFGGDHAFDSDGSAIVCTMHGDVWRVSGFPFPSTTATWQRIASGLHHPLGLVADEDGIFVLGRDQITRLHDLNGDGHTDWYQCVSRAYETSPAGHDFICGLQRDRDGYFYTASGNQGLLKLSPDGATAEVIATGFRNPDGLGLSTAGSEGWLTVPCSEGEWTPASMICLVELNQASPESVPHFGYPGPRDGRTPELPLVYLPRGLDNSAGGQTTVTSRRWGPLEGQLLHFSFGAGAHFLILRDRVDGQWQGAVVPLPGEFRSGAHRGRFSPTDGQLYVTGMQGWGSYTIDNGCFQRVRYTGDPVQLPVRYRAHQNGVCLDFTEPLDPAVAGLAASHFAQCWNYRYSAAYGSAEYSSLHYGVRGHDVLRISHADLSPDRRRLFLEIPDLQPVNQLHLRVQTEAGGFQDLFATVHRLAEPYRDYPAYQPRVKPIADHPLVADMAMATRKIPNPHQEPLPAARKITIATGSNLTYQTTEFRAAPGEAIALTLHNTDVVPHNWVLAAPGTLEGVGQSASRLIGDPDAWVKQYVPDTESVLVFTDVVLPQQEFTVYFRAPQQPGHYPYLCTFPGHWSVMNGVLVVE